MATLFLCFAKGSQKWDDVIYEGQESCQWLALWQPSHVIVQQQLLKLCICFLQLRTKQTSGQGWVGSEEVDDFDHVVHCLTKVTTLLCTENWLVNDAVQGDHMGIPILPLCSQSVLASQNPPHPLPYPKSHRISVTLKSDFSVDAFFFFFTPEISRATQFGVAGHKWPAGQLLVIPVLDHRY